MPTEDAELPVKLQLLPEVRHIVSMPMDMTWDSRHLMHDLNIPF